jgi:starch phosphorylase
MKAALNGVPQLGTTDGWWEEGYTGENGWTIPPADPSMDTEEADAHDHEELFRLLESEVVPAFYDRRREGAREDPPAQWLFRMKRAMAVAGARFSARRMVQEYARDYYVPALRGEAPDDPPAGHIDLLDPAPVAEAGA